MYALLSCWQAPRKSAMLGEEVLSSSRTSEWRSSWLMVLLSQLTIRMADFTSPQNPSQTSPSSDLLMSFSSLIVLNLMLNPFFICFFIFLYLYIYVCIYNLFLRWEDWIKVKKKDYIRLLSFCVNFFYLKWMELLLKYQSFLLLFVCLCVCVCIYVYVCILWWLPFFSYCCCVCSFFLFPVIPFYFLKLKEKSSFFLLNPFFSI